MKIKELFCIHKYNSEWSLGRILWGDGTSRMILIKICSKCGKIKYLMDKEYYLEWKKSWKQLVNK